MKKTSFNFKTFQISTNFIKAAGCWIIGTKIKLIKVARLVNLKLVLTD